MNRSFRGKRSTTIERRPSGFTTGRHVRIVTHGQNFTPEKERMSVFDRLGTKRGGSSGRGGGGGNYTDYSGRKPPSSVRRPPPEDEGMSYHDKYSTDFRHGHGTSPSSNYRTRTEQSPGFGDSRRHGQEEHGSLSKSKHREGRRTTKGHSSSKSKKISKRKKKGEASSSDSSSKAGTSSGSKSRSSSSSGSDATSSSAADSDSSESSAPSIKLRTGKKRPSDKVNKEKRSNEPTSKKAIGSSSSSIVSTPTKHEVPRNRGMERINSPYHRENEKEYIKERDYDRRSNLALNTRDYAHPQGSGSMERERERTHYPKHDALDPINRKRQQSVESYGSGGKRSRRFTPTPDRYQGSSRHSPGSRRIPPPSPDIPHDRRRYAPQPSRRITPPPEHLGSRKDRSPPQERIRIIKPDKHPYYEESHHREDRYDDRPKDTRGRQFSPGMGMIERPRERLAPARSSPPGRRAAPPAPQDFEPPIKRRAPLLPIPTGADSLSHSQGPPFGCQRGTAAHRDFPPSPSVRPGSSQGPAGPVRQHVTPIPRAKEYEAVPSGRQSRVDSWVDETLPANRPALLPTPACGPYKHPPAIVPETTARIPVRKEVQTISMEKEKKPDPGAKVEPLEEVLSDFSDDAEEILNEAPAAKDSTEDKLSEKTIINKAVSSEPIESSTEQKDASQKVVTSKNNNKTPNDVDVLEELAEDLEEISDDEFGELERKTGIVDALGVDWSSLLSAQESKNGSAQENKDEGMKKISLRQRWCPANRFKMSGFPRSLFGDTFFNKIYGEVQLMEEKDGIKPEDRTTKDELEFPSLRRRRLERTEFIRKIGALSHTAYTRPRDRALRRFVLGRPQAPAGGFPEIPQSTTVHEEEESDLDIFHKCCALLKETMVKC